MADALSEGTLQSGAEGTRTVAFKYRPGGPPGLIFLGGYRSDMEGTKAQALDRYGAAKGLGVMRFDYSGHGRSSGEFDRLGISEWLEDCVAVFEKTEGPQIIIGSSMGGWLALLLNRELRARGTDRVAGLILIAPAADMTTELMLPGFSKEERAMLEATGKIERPSDYGAPEVITNYLIEDGARHLMFGNGTITTGCEVHILQGGQDSSVPPAHAQKLVSHLVLDPVSYTLVPDGDHSLSREQDMVLVFAAIERIAGGKDPAG